MMQYRRVWTILENKKMIDSTVEIDCKAPGFVVAQEKLLEKLLRGGLAAGEAIKESALAREFGVNRPSVREALCQAIGWGVVEYVPYCGYRIRDFSLGDLLDWYKLREGIEPIAARDLAENRPPSVLRELEAIIAASRENSPSPDAPGNDLAFHMALVSGCGNKRFADPAMLCYFAVIFAITIESVIELNYRDGLYPQLREKCSTLEEYRSLVRGNSGNSHAKILELIRAGETSAAEEWVRGHARARVDSMRKMIDFYGDRDLPLNELLRRRRRSPEKIIRSFIGGASKSAGQPKQG